jgi:hypothetical protein
LATGTITDKINSVVALSASEQAPCRPPITIKLPWISPSFVAIKGILHAPSTKPAMSPERRDALLAAIAKARGWIEGIRPHHCRNR